MDQDGAVRDLAQFLDRLRPVGGRSAGGRGSRFYGMGTGQWTAPLVRRDLWRRACAVVDRGALRSGDVQLWGHWYGVSDGYAWSRAEILRRFALGRPAAERAVTRVTRAVARGLREAPPAARPTAPPTPPARSALEDAAAVALGRAVTARHRHRAEIRYALHDALERYAAEGGIRGGQRRLPIGTTPRKPNLKTSRYLPVAHTALHRAMADSGLHRTDADTEPRQVALPLWERVEPETADLAEALKHLTALDRTVERAEVVRVLREGHHHILHRSNDRDLVCTFLAAESEILGWHVNIGQAAILEILDRLLEPGDPRRVDAARERVHILERHHYWSAAWAWADRMWRRLHDPRIVWSDPDERRLAVARGLVRHTSLAAKYASVFPDATPPDLTTLARRITRVLAGLGDEGRAREWWTVARRRELQARWAIKNRDRLLGLPASWDDEELAVIEVIDRCTAGLGLPGRALGWNNQKLNVLLTADRPGEFHRAMDEFLPDLVAHGEAWPSQVSAAHSTLVLALRRRSRRWRPLHDEMVAWLAKLPAHTDDALRNPYAIPRRLVVNGVCIN